MVKIRQMKVEDIVPVVRQEKDIFGESLGYDFFYQDLVLNPFQYYYVLEKDEEIIGFIGAYINSDTCDVVSFYVVQEMQNQGYGKMLFNFLLDLCEEMDVNLLTLEVRKSNKKAISIYEKFGLNPIYIRRRYYRDGEDAILYGIQFERGKKKWLF